MNPEIQFHITRIKNCNCETIFKKSFLKLQDSSFKPQVSFFVNFAVDLDMTPLGAETPPRKKLDEV